MHINNIILLNYQSHSPLLLCYFCTEDLVQKGAMCIDLLLRHMDEAFEFKLQHVVDVDIAL
jgi:hypothetical protein